MRKKTRQLLDTCLPIAEEYGGNLTVRQLYYQLVARGLSSNSQKAYDRVVRVLSKARLQGDFPLGLLVDRTRRIRPGDFSTDNVSVEQAFEEAIYAIKYQFDRWYLSRSRWWGQDHYVSVWVEKEALAGVFAPVCNELGVPLFVCRGYTSVSSLEDWLGGYRDTVAVGGGTAAYGAVVLYFGDHDPDGLEIPDSAARNIIDLAGVMNCPELVQYMGYSEGKTAQLSWKVRGKELTFDTRRGVTFYRCALTPEQIQAHNPPPFPAKERSSRYTRYVEKTGQTSAWELDALSPPLLEQLIRQEVSEWFEEDRHANNVALVESRRATFREQLAQRLADAFPT